MSEFEVMWRDELIRDLRKALKFYADKTSYRQRVDWDGDPDMSKVDSDNGKIARAALEKR